MATFQEIIKEPEFQQFGNQDKIAILDRVDPDFKALSPEAKTGVVGQLNRQALKASRGIGQPIRQQSQQEQAAREKINARSGVNNFGRGVIGGVEEIGRGALQTGAAALNIFNPLDSGIDEGVPNKLVSDAKRKEIDAATIKQQQELNFLTNQSQAAQAGRVGGNTAALVPLAFIPGLRATPLKTPLQNVSRFAKQGAVAGPTFPVENKDNFLSTKLMQAGTGAGFGGITPIAIGGVGKGITSIAQKTNQAVKNTGSTLRGVAKTLRNRTLTDGDIVIELQTNLKAEGIDFNSLTDNVRNQLLRQVKGSLKQINPSIPAEIVRRQNFREVTGEDPTLGQLKRDFAQQQFEGNLKNVGDIGRPLKQKQDRQNRAIQDRVENIAGRTGASPEVLSSSRAGDPFPAGQSFNRAASGRAKATQSEVSKLYDAAAEANGNRALIPQDEFFEGAVEIIDTFEDVIPQPVLKRLHEFGINPEGKATRRFSIEEGEKLRKLITARIPGADLSGKTALEQIAMSLDDAVARLPIENEAASIGRQARQLAERRFRELRGPDIIPGSPKFKNFPLKPFTQGGMILEDEVSKKVLVRTQPDELELVLDSMAKSGPDGKQAVADLQGELIMGSLAKSLRETQRTGLDDAEFVIQKFRQELIGKVGERKLKILFRENPEILNEIEQAIQVGIDRIPITGTQNTSGTGTFLLSIADLIGKIPGLGNVGNVVRGFTASARKGLEVGENQARVAAALNLDESIITDELRRQSTQRINGLIDKLIANGTIPEIGVAIKEDRRRLSVRLREEK